MIHSFSCKNFYSFKNLVEVSFVVDEETSKKDLFFPSPAGATLSKVNIIVGANAVGKTNLLKVLSFIQWFMLKGPKYEDKPMPFKKFFDDNEDESYFSLVFEINKKIYLYELKILNSIVLEESLKTKNSISDKYKMYFSRKLVDNKYKISNNNIEFSEPIKKLSLPNASMVGAAANYENQESRKIVDFIKNINTNVDLFDDGYGLINKNYEKLQKSLENYKNNKELKDDINRFIEGIDTRINDIETRVYVSEDKTFKHFFAVCVHKIQNKLSKVDIRDESSGIKQMLIILNLILGSTYSKGGQGKNIINVIDEIDNNLHPDITKEFVDLFIYSDEEKSDSMQTIFATHNHLLLEGMDKYNIILVQKDSNEISIPFRLDDMKGVDKNDNYFKGYIAGRYGAKPDITI